MAVSPARPRDEGTVADTAADSLCKRSARPWVLAATILASSMVFIDGTVVNVALPALQRAFNASATDVQWVVESYALFLAALLLVGGAAGDRFGRRRVFALGVGLFAVASVWCGLTGNIMQLIFARAVQGIGGALLVPGSLALISASFPENERGKAIGTWSGYTAITAAIGPVVGGFLIEHVSWRLAFLINVPLALLVIFLTFRYVPESRDQRASGSLDWTGAALASIGLGCLVYALIESSNKGWGDVTVIATLVLAVLMIAVFISVELRHPAPMLPLRLFHSRNFSGANLLTLQLYAALGGGLYFLPLNLILVQGYSAVAAGAALLPFVLLMFSLSRWSGGLVDRYGAKRPLVIGPTIAAIGFALFAVPGVGGSYWNNYSANYWANYFPAVLVLGFGMSISVAPLTTTVMNAVDQSLAGAASGVNNAVSRTAALLAIAVFGIVMNLAFNANLDRHLKTLHIAPEKLQAVEVQRAKLAAIALPPEASGQEQTALKNAVSQSYVSGFRWVMLLSAFLALGSALSAWMLIGNRPQEEQKT
ncbi:drug resistance transporter, EmrB/QacA subfamily [Collimonas sp. OK307]|uniref:MFS transporter n=1 Tax=Collimonas sp. OK307 TaxID=1801620 RepID=UPI0008E122DC|nr:MFS transporter [Collimonas sp. OK307]SFH60844.1 drug resistance transporter, EmrB/QacA subfamily [Collimonas sp. OK307]